MLFTSNCEYCTKTNFIFCDVWQHFWSNPCYYNNRKNPPIHYIKFYYPHSKIPSPKEQRSIAVLFFLLFTSKKDNKCCPSVMTLVGRHLLSLMILFFCPRTKIPQKIRGCQYFFYKYSRIENLVCSPFFSLTSSNRLSFVVNRFLGLRPIIRY